ncbi:MAG TPA: FtsQ-type POTRA domain-containing protein [Acidobacteriaceae bacterium]
MRAGNLFSNRSSAVLDAPESPRAAKGLRAAGLKRSALVTEMPLRRDGAYDYPEDEAEIVPRERRGVRINLRDGLLPKTLWGRIAAVCVLMLIAGAAIAALIETRSFLLHDARFIVPDEHAIQVAGASHLTHAQLLSVFGEDVDRNIFTIPLSERRAELERLPWVEHATVMRLLPDHLRVSIVERTPVAFVREGVHIALVDATGAIFDMPGPEMVAAGGGGQPHYSFPVLTGISAADPLSTRGARMKICMAFIAALDSTGEKISSKLSEIDLSDPEDIRAVVSDSGGSDVLVHFGEDRFLDRYHAYRQHLAEWRAQYPRLASVDMRYEQQVVLGMKPDAPGTPATPSTNTGATTAPTAPAALAAASAPGSSWKSSKAMAQAVAPKSASVNTPLPPIAKSTAHPPRHWKPHAKKAAAPHAKPRALAPAAHIAQGAAR